MTPSWKVLVDRAHSHRNFSYLLYVSREKTDPFSRILCETPVDNRAKITGIGYTSAHQALMIFVHRMCNL